MSGLPLGSLLAFHTSWSWVVIMGNGLAGLWSLAAARWPPLGTRALWWFTAAAQLSVFVEVGLGVGMVAGQDRQVEQFHMFYGFIAIVAVAIIYSYRHQLRHRLHLLYGFGGLFIMGLAIRAALLGQP